MRKNENSLQGRHTLPEERERAHARFPSDRISEQERTSKPTPNAGRAECVVSRALNSRPPVFKGKYMRQR